MRAKAAVLAACALLATAAAAQAAEETPEVMPAGQGRDEVFFFCTACHSSLVIRRQGMSRERWDETLKWMTERQGMPALEGAERALFLDYLAAAFPPTKAPPPSPFLSR